MRRSKFFKGSSVVLAMALCVAMVVPGMATEAGEVPAEEEAVVLSVDEPDADAAEPAVVSEEQSEPEEPAAQEPEADVEEPETGSDADEEDVSAPVTLADPTEQEPGPAVENVTVTAKEGTLNVVGQTTELTVEIQPEDASVEKIDWSSSNDSVAAVDGTDDKATVTAGSTNGTATITCTVTYTAETDDGEAESLTASGDAAITVSLYDGGLYQDPDGTDWYYYTKGKIDTSKSGAVSGTVNGTQGVWNVANGKLKKEADVVKYNGDWWYFNNNGMLDKSYTGFATNANGSWYMENGLLERDENSVIKDKTGALGDSSEYYYVVASKVQSSFTGLAHYSNASGWWYITNGKVDRTYNGLAKNQNGWFYLKNGKVDRTYTGFATNENGSWYMEKGKLERDENTVIKDTTGALGTKGEWYYVIGSKVQSSFTGLANYRNSSGWWYITKGKVDRTYNGLAKNKNGWFYLSKGKVDRSYTGFAKNSSGDWYVQSGKVTKTLTSVVQDGKGVLGAKGNYYYVSGSKVQYNFTGIASNSNGSWYIKNGKLDRTYSGTITYNGTTYNVTKGKATASTPYSSLGMSKTMYDKAQSQSSSTKWLIMVDVDNCKLGVFQGSKNNWTPYKYWDCTTGAAASPTVRGTFSITGKGYSFGDSDHTCYYYSQFYGNYLIHSILYYPGTFNVKSGTLGAHLSNGCVRLSLENAKWVYDNVPYSTRVVTY